MYKILITSSNKYNVLKRISINLIEKKLSPCAHIIKDVQSFYRWEGRVVNDEEYLLLVKCVNKNMIEIKEIIYKNHNYEIPEIICHEFTILSEKYRKWFNNSVKLNIKD